MAYDINLNSDILVVDDNAVVLGIIKRFLDDKFNVRVASSAKEAHIKLEEKIPDLILLDLEMPEINGLEFIQMIKKNPLWSDIPVIFLTGITDRAKEEQALEMGAAEYLQKPVIEGILLKRINFHLELRQYREKLEEMVVARTEELTKTQGELQLAVEAAREALLVKSSFHANMSHEIRAPLNSIMGYSEMALAGPISKETEKYIQKTKESTVFLLRMINDILDISKIEAGKMEIEKISFCPGNVISGCQAMILPQINEKGLYFTSIIDEELKTKLVLGDPVRLYQALLNLLSNAVRFSNRGTITLSVQAVSMDNGKAVLRFIVEDSGIGMSESQLSRIFEPFAQVSTLKKDKKEGSGLGLSITKGLIDLMGGTITAESKLGIGSKFIVDITFDITETESLFDDVFGESALDSIEKPQFKGEVLVCEDDVQNQQVITKHLQRVGLECKIANNGLEGLQIVMDRMKSRKRPFDVILMDIQMPVMDGYEATARINALGLGTPIVALVANIMAADSDEYKRNGMMDCIGKPFQTWDLWRCLLSFLTPYDKETIEDKISALKAPVISKTLDALENKDRKGILIIDDEKSNIITLSYYLREEFNVFVTRNSREALEMAETHKPNVILLDVLMPEMDGYEVITALKKSDKAKDIPVIFISGLVEQESIDKAMALGAAGYITKPFISEDVKMKIYNAMTYGVG